MTRRERRSRLVEWARLVDEEVPESALQDDPESAPERADHWAGPAEADPRFDDRRDRD